MKLLGIPLAIWGVVCLVVAVIRVFVWPSNKSVETNSLPHFILRRFQALMWLFLPAAASIAGLDIIDFSTRQPPRNAWAGRVRGYRRPTRPTAHEHPGRRAPQPEPGPHPPTSRPR